MRTTLPDSMIPSIDGHIEPGRISVMLPQTARLARSSAFVVAAMVLFAVGGCQSSGGNGRALDAGSHAGDACDARYEIRALVDRYTQALLSGDVATLDRIWADDLTFINLRGELLNKQNRMDNIRSGATAFKSIRLSDERIRMYGQVAVATYRTALEAQYSGQEGSGSYRVTIVCAQPKGLWQIVAVHMTRITR
jgi:uncharacterized protein (TIGR02246 family)